MPEPRIDLDSILKIERNKRKKLVPLENDFYEKVAGQIRKLEDEKRKIDDPYGTKYAMLDDSLKTTRKAIDSIIYNRTTKIIQEARHTAEIAYLHGSSDDMGESLDSMTLEEQKFYNSIVELMTGYRQELAYKIFNKTSVIETTHSSPQPEKHEKSENIPIKHKETLPEEGKPEEGKKDISKDYMLVRLLKDIPTFVGADGRNHTLMKEDVAVLSKVNADALINRKAATQIPVKR
ncbi:MAG: hypothetical protein OIN89_04620 [Candidatus Methanoperedens sp.]|jgi:DNA replication factor GINS|nr:hypothetical protein [Candidatus Methanoperedens sp.]PKL52894.1 MAG: hypothetical protein CVV36_09985 [Candidatus Methanoperedenaceae archaeon HGW-Methanoperedenaceae-1]